MTSEGRVALKFDLSSLPSNIEITSATFSVYRLGDYFGYDYAATMYISPINKSWTDNAATWDNLALSCDAPVTEVDLPSGTTGWLDFDVTELIQDFIDGSKVDNGIMLSCTTSYTGNSHGQYSYLVGSESSDTERIPKLEIEYTGGTNIDPANYSNFSNSLFIKAKKNKLIINSYEFYNNLTGSLVSVKGEKIDLKFNNLKVGINTLNLPDNLSKGMYLIHIKNRNINFTKKILIN